MISRGISFFRSFRKLLGNVVTETFAEPAANWQVSSNRMLTDTIRRQSCPFACVKLVIHDVTCGFRLVNFTAQNLISRGLPIFGSFCKPLRNVVTETIAEPSANWQVSSTRILTGRPSGSFINVKLVIHYLMYGFRPFSSAFQLTCEVTRAPNFQTVLQTSEEFCNKNIPVVFTTSTNIGGSARGF